MSFNVSNRRVQANGGRGALGLHRDVLGEFPLGRTCSLLAVREVGEWAAPLGRPELSIWSNDR